MSIRTRPSPVVSTEDIEGTPVYDGRGRKLGRIDHLNIDKVSGSVVSVVLTIAGFFGIGHSHREVPWEALIYSPERHGYHLTDRGTP
jgi:sporulation protein YlmC with PRC-barrel domain